MSISINLFPKKKHKSIKGRQSKSIIGKILSGIGDIFIKIISILIVIGILLAMIWYFNPSLVEFLLK